jgi:hypothetical protein
MSELHLSFNIDTVENGGESKKREKPKEGISSYRILPPFGTNHGGSLSHKYSVHWGFIGESGKERSVGCSYPTEGYCPVCTRVREADEELKRAQANKNEKLATELTEYISKFRLKKFWLYNAVTADGRIVMLELGKMAHDDLSKRISEAVRRKTGAYDPTSPETGVWFEFTRTGKGFNTEYKVDFKKIAMTLDDGTVVDKPDRTPLASELIASIKEGLAGKVGVLHDIHVAHEPTSSSDLRGLMSGGVVKSKRTNQPVSAPAAETQSAPSAGPVDMSKAQAEIERLKLLKTSSQTA